MQKQRNSIRRWRNETNRLCSWWQLNRHVSSTSRSYSLFSNNILFSK